jgi:ABC-type Fe3+ transport system permease subunit
LTFSGAGRRRTLIQEPVVKQTFLSGATLAALTMLVALPLVFILLQAIFPHFSAGSLGDAFGGVSALLADPQLMAMLGGTLWIAAGVALVSVMIGLPLGICAVCFRCRCPGCGISVFDPLSDAALYLGALVDAGPAKRAICS